MGVDDEPPWVATSEPPRWVAPAWLGEVSPPRTRAGAPISPDARLRWLAALEAGGEALARFERWLCARSTRAHAWALLEAWAAHGADPRDGWVLAGLRDISVEDLEAQLGEQRGSAPAARALLERHRARLERAISTGRDWSSADFRHRLLDHPLWRHLARRLVWVARREDGAPVATFVVGADGGLEDLDQEPVALPPRCRIELLHPAELEPSERAAWGERLAEAELVQPFAQLARPVWEVAPEDARGDTLSRFPRGAPDGGALTRTLLARAWVRGEPDERMRTRFFYKPFPRAGLHAVLRFEPGLPSEAAQRVEEAFFVARLPGGVTFAAEPRVPLADVPARVSSELLHDLGALAG